jgi:hypothetical protein
VLEGKEFNRRIRDATGEVSLLQYRSKHSCSLCANFICFCHEKNARTHALTHSLTHKEIKARKRENCHNEIHICCTDISSQD